LVLMGLAAAVATAADVAVAAPAPSKPTATIAAGRGGATASHKNGKPKKPVRPTMSVVGFGVNRLFAPKGATIKSSSMCDEIVGADGPIGPPQQVYLTAYLRAKAIPAKAPTQIADSLPGAGGDFTSPELSPPVPWSQAFAKGSFFGGPTTGDQKDLFYLPIVSFSAEQGTYEGPSSEEFDGMYSFTASVKVGGRTLTSKAEVTVACPYLR
jgi:hypothetical protein